jgi:HEPN domain-containing protein
MSNLKFNEWDSLPINLSPEQIANPLTVIDDFFSSDWLPGHIEHLHRWRKFILEDAFFVDTMGNPSTLLTSFKHNIKLIEACHLILGNRDIYNQSIASGIGQIENERKAWKHYPELLNLGELLNPLTILESFFDAFSLPEYREQLNGWLDTGLSHRAGGEFMETADIIAVYENLQKLYGAALLIYQRLTDDPYLKKDATETDGPNIESGLQLSAPSLYKLNSVITSDQHEQITQIVTIIKDRVASIQAIIYLGVPALEQPVIFLLALTDNNEQSLAQDISNHLEESCRKIAQVFVLVHHAASLITATDEKNLFLKKAANCPVIYLSGGLILPKQKETDHLLITEIALNKWQRWHSQGLEFLKGAEYYLTIGANNAALFSLSQTAECLLVAIIRFVTGYEINTHNLERLLKLTQMFTGDISAVFGLDSEDNKKLFNVLKGAYVDVRYRDKYKAAPISISAIYILIKQMSSVVDQINQKHLLLSTL